MSTTRARGWSASAGRAGWRSRGLTALGLALLLAGCGSVAAVEGQGDGGGRDGPGGGPSALDGGQLAPLGVACELAAECLSGFCTDGVCCDVSCTGACVACNQAEQLGRCAPMPAGAADQHGVCVAEPVASCGLSGFCNGQGGCAKFSAGTVCRPASCSDPQSFLPASLCDGDGACRPGTAVSCAPSTCEAGACLGSCTRDETCVPPQTCVSGTCGPKGLGQDCLSSAQCGSGFCVDGVCCESACTGRCFYCANPEARGKCTPGKPGTVDQRAARGETDPTRICADGGAAACAQNGRCDGAGGCQRYADGTVCRPPRCDAAGNSDTAPGTCGAGACRVPASGSCAPYLGCSGSQCRGSCDSDGQCAAGFVCLAGGTCGKRRNGEACLRALECMSGTCAQGRCCATACTASCKSCGLPGMEGTCASVAAGGADPTGACRDDACSNGCDGAGGCRRESVGTMCGAPGCGPGDSIATRVCNGGGVCETRTMPGPSCGRCGGTTLCDGGCSRPTPPNLDAACGRCGGKIRCDARCSVDDPPGLGDRCGSAGAIDCSGGCRGPLFRLYHPGVDDHFYTMSAGERDQAVAQFGYTSEGVAGLLYEGRVAGTTPLFRLYHGPTGDHFYTASAEERDRAVGEFGYALEGTTGFIHTDQAAGTIPLFRLYSGAAGDHFYTASAEERDRAVAQFGYVFEGVTGFVFPP